MIVFASCVGSPEKFATCALPGLRLAAEPDSPIVEAGTTTSIFEAYNEILEAVADLPELEALVLLHEDVEITDPAFCNTIRAAFQEPDVAIAGAIGARRVSSLAWWEGETFGRVLESRGLIDFGGGTYDVETVDGLVLVLSPWAARNLRFDAARFTGFHGYDADLCFQARAAGRRVVVTELPLTHHTKGGYGDLDAYRAADRAFREKWLHRPAAAA